MWMHPISSWDREPGGGSKLRGPQGRVGSVDLGPATCTATGKKLKLSQHGGRQQQCLWLVKTS